MPQISVMRTLLFLIYINDIPQGLNSEVKPFADNTSLSTIVNCVNTSALTLNGNLLKTQDWAYQKKMSFNPDQTKQAQEVIFSRKINATIHPPFFSTILKLSSFQLRSIWALL